MIWTIITIRLSCPRAYIKKFGDNVLKDILFATKYIRVVHLYACDNKVKKYRQRRLSS